MSEGITPKQALVIWCLLGRHGWAAQGEIIPKVGRKDREALVAAGYITSTKVNRALVLKVEDKGWHWASSHLDAELPATFRALQNWLARVGDFLGRNGGTLADFIGPAPQPCRPPRRLRRRRALDLESSQRQRPLSPHLPLFSEGASKQPI